MSCGTSVELSSITVLFFSDQWVMLWFSPQGTWGCICNWSACVAASCCSPGRGQRRTFLYMSIGFPMNLSNAPARKVFAECYFEIKLWQACSNPLSPYWDMALAFISHSDREPQIYFPKCAKWVCVNTTRQWCFSLWAFDTSDALRPNYCENLRKFAGGSGGRVI